LSKLNQFLIGESTAELEGFLYAGDRAQLHGIRFVITLDGRYPLLRDTARRMIETLAHPLNQGVAFARWSPHSSRLHDHSTKRQRVASERNGNMVLTHLADRVGSTLHARGLRCLPGFGRRRQFITAKAFTNCRRFTSSYQDDFQRRHLLSHDLLEGCHVRVGLATDIELLDVFPNSYIAWWSRQAPLGFARLANH